MFKMLSNEEFLEKLKLNNIKHIPLEEYKGSSIKIKFMCGKNNNHIFEIDPSSIYSDKNPCPYCSKRKVFIGETDMWTTNPKLASMLADKEDGYKYFDGSCNKVDWICPRCGSIIKNKIIKNVKTQGLSCPNCSDRLSYGEKFVYSLLEQLHINFIFDRTTSWSENKRYDFYIPDYSLIIEIHGIQHYERGFMFKNSKYVLRCVEDEKNNDIYKRNMALNNGIKNYIELDCRKSEFNYIKKSILESGLSKIFDLSEIDWDLCLKNTFNSNVIKCANLWNDGVKNTSEISKITGIHISSVISYLKRAKKIGLCNYVKNYNKNKKGCKPVICLETNKIYESISKVKEDGYDYTSVSKCCNKHLETAHGLHWNFI